MNQKPFLFIGCVLLIGFGIGFISGRSLGGRSEVSRTESAQVQKLRQQIERAKTFFPAISADVRHISGTVKEVRGKTIVVEILPINPFDESPRTRTITIGNETKILRNETKDTAVFQGEIAEFQKAIQSQKSGPGAAPISPPRPFREVSAAFSDIHAGQMISVTAQENIRDKESFTATTVNIS